MVFSRFAENGFAETPDLPKKIVLRIFILQLHF